MGADIAAIIEDQRSLPQIAEYACGKHQDQPGAGNRAAAEVAHVGVQRLGACHGQHDGGQSEERDVEMAQPETSARTPATTP